MPSPTIKTSKGMFSTTTKAGIGQAIVMVQIATTIISTVDLMRKHIALKSQNVNMSEFGHDTGQRFDEYY